MPPPGPKRLEKYYEPCMERYDDEEYCARVAWNIYCVARGTYVPGSWGVLPVESVLERANALEIVRVAGGGEAKMGRINAEVAAVNGCSGATYVIERGAAPVCRVRTDHGYDVRCTPDHQVLTLDPGTWGLLWTPAGSLRAGDYVALGVGHQCAGSELNLPGWTFAPRAMAWHPATRPLSMDAPLARILGYLVSEGTVTKKEVIFTNSDPDVLEDYKRCLAACFGEDVAYDEVWRGASCHVRLRRVWYVQFFQSLGLMPGKAANKKVPECVLAAPSSVVLEFLAAYAEGDGMVRQDKRRVEFGTSSAILAKQLQVLLTNYGVCASRRLDPTSDGTEFWVVQIGGQRDCQLYGERIGAVFKCAPEFDVVKTRGRSFDMLPVQALKMASRRCRGSGLCVLCNGEQISRQRILSHWERFERAANKDAAFVESARKLACGNLRFDRVNSVARCGVDATYDLVVPEQEAFVADGFVVHNCSHVNPDYEGCTEYGKEWGRPYSAPVGPSPASRRVRARRRLRAATRLLAFAVNPYLNTPPTELRRMVEREPPGPERRLMEDALTAWRVTVPGPFRHGPSGRRMKRGSRSRRQGRVSRARARH